MQSLRCWTDSGEHKHIFNAIKWVTAIVIQSCKLWMMWMFVAAPDRARCMSLFLFLIVLNVFLSEYSSHHLPSAALINWLYMFRILCMWCIASNRRYSLSLSVTGLALAHKHYPELEFLNPMWFQVSVIATLYCFYWGECPSKQTLGITQSLHSSSSWSCYHHEPFSLSWHSLWLTMLIMPIVLSLCCADIIMDWGLVSYQHLKLFICSPILYVYVAGYNLHVCIYVYVSTVPACFCDHDLYVVLPLVIHREAKLQTIISSETSYTSLPGHTTRPSCWTWWCAWAGRFWSVPARVTWSNMSFCC